MSNLTDNVGNVVVLMLENRSFDTILGGLYAGGSSPVTGQPFDGAQGTVTTNDTNVDPDPYEYLDEVYLQQFGADAPASGWNRTDAPPMNGFVDNYTAAIKEWNGKFLHRHEQKDTVGAQIAYQYDATVLPNTWFLAQQFAVCDRWYSAVPSDTWPNRRFALSGTSFGDIYDTPKVELFWPTIFDNMATAGVTWKIYADGPSLTAILWPHLIGYFSFGSITDFENDCAAGTLPQFAFVEPDYSSAGNSMHPPYPVSPGDLFIAQIYNAVRGNTAQWDQTLLLVTFDEHGGTADHAPPPATAVAPDSHTQDGFDFTRFGVRVPMLMISPYIPAGTVYRPAAGTCDHTSILSTLELLFGLDPLTNRDKVAPALDGLLGATLRTDCPPSTNLTPAPTASSVLSDASNLAPNHLLVSMLDMATRLPTVDRYRQWCASGEGRAPSGKPNTDHLTEVEALQIIQAKINEYLRALE